MTNSAESATRRKLQELRTLYMLKPHFRDVIVEGRDDARLLNWFFKDQGVPHAKAYAVDDRVEVPSALVAPIHDEINARGRIVAVASESDAWNLTQSTVTCVIDADYDLLEKRLQQTTNLLVTDYAAMEVYSLESRPLSKFLVFAAKSDLEAGTVTALLKPVWAVIYALRYVLHRHENGSKLAENFADSCFDKAGDVLVDVSKLLRKVSPTPTATRMSELLDLHAKILAEVPESGLQGIRGHDIAPVLIRFLGLKNDLGKPDNVERLLRSSIELRDLEEFPLFNNVLKRTMPSS